MIALAMLLFFVAIASLVVGCFAAAIFVWLMSRDRHDPHAFAFNDHPFFSSAGVARPDARGPSPRPRGPRAVFPPRAAQ